MQTTDAEMLVRHQLKKYSDCITLSRSSVPCVKRRTTAHLAFTRWRSHGDRWHDSGRQVSVEVAANVKGEHTEQVDGFGRTASAACAERTLSGTSGNTSVGKSSSNSALSSSSSGREWSSTNASRRIWFSCGRRPRGASRTSRARRRRPAALWRTRWPSSSCGWSPASGCSSAGTRCAACCAPRGTGPAISGSPPTAGPCAPCAAAASCATADPARLALRSIRLCASVRQATIMGPHGCG